MVNKTKNGFTLAEVLITLVIIGIVAALTISAVINTYVERSTVAKVKKALSILAQAKNLPRLKTVQLSAGIIPREILLPQFPNFGLI